MSALVRRTPLRPKRPNPRRRGATCSVRSCRGRPRVLGLCRTHATQRADRLVGDFVKARDRGCVIVGSHSGPLQWSHLISCRYRATRWDPQNSVAMCAGHHVYYTHHPLEFDLWKEFWLGPVAFDKLKHKALGSARPDLEFIIGHFGKGLSA